MLVRIFRGVWFLSLLAVFANLLYVYASLPEQVVVLDGATDRIVMQRDSLFYIAMGALAIINVLVYVFSQKLMPAEDFRVWLNGLVIVLNIFFIIGLSFISLYNSAEKYDFGRLGTIIYASVWLVTIWAIGWPVYVLVRKIFSKPVV